MPRSPKLFPLSLEDKNSYAVKFNIPVKNRSTAEGPQYTDSIGRTIKVYSVDFNFTEAFG